MIQASRCILGTVLVAVMATSASAHNQYIDSFNKAKRYLEREVYTDYRKTIYCDADYDEKKNAMHPAGFISEKYVKRSKRIEWEHVVPAENFGRTFVEWRDGDKECVDSKGKSFKGRNCAKKVNTEFRYMESDLHNLFPAIGSVNALRSNYNFTVLPDAQPTFGSCDMRISGRKAHPPEIARGQIARAYLYMDSAYSRYNMSKSQKKLMVAWDKTYPVTDWECTRTSRIVQIQGNDNPFVSKHCMSEP
ncbi:endonuclease [Desulfosediminicola ganghwensis]|uniref:endonuclease n=1 Tax=Desulfosediminicola ganghwensis TaxID=2569540 RepID=UPI0010AB5E7F|nr:endonuclease [Desulfosediminicola ganghwensis]